MNILTLIPLTSFVGIAILIAIVWTHHPRLKIHKVFVTMLVFAGLWSFSSFMLHANFFPEQAFFWYSCLILFVVCASTAYYYFSQVFVNKPIGWGVYVGCGALVMFFISIVLGYYIKDVYVTNGFIHTEESLWLHLLTVLIPLFLGAGIFFNFAQRYRGSNEPIVRNQVGYLLLGLLIVVVLSVGNFFPGLQGYPIDQVGVLLNCVVIAYVIIRYHLFSMRVVLRRGLAWAGLIAVGIGIYLLLFLSVRLLAGLELNVVALALTTLAVVAIVVIVYLLRGFFVRGVDRFFYKKSYDYRQKLFGFVKYELSGVFNLQQLSEGMLPLLVGSVGCRRAILLLPEASGDDFVVEFAEPQEDSDLQLRIRQDSPILEWLKRENRYLSRENLDILPEFRSLWGEERDNFKALDIELLFPLISRGNLIGILALDKKKSGRYSLDDINLAEDISSRVAVSLEKEYLQEQLRKREQELALVNRLAGVITSSLNIQEVYDVFIAGLREVVDVDFATIVLIEGDELYFSVLCTEVGSAWQTGERLSLKGTATKWVAERKKALVELDLAQSRRFRTGEEYIKRGIRSIVYLPLLVKGEAIGCLIIASRRPKAYSPGEVRLLERLAAQIAAPVENSRLYAKAEQRARIDELTGLFNRRHFDERIKQEIDRHSRYRGMLSLILIDLDFFKDFNDKKGHLAGDKMLAKVGRLMEMSVRNVDMAFRYGGDEFAVLLPQATTDDAFVVAERIRGRIASEMGSKQAGITVSLGLASWPSDGVTPDEMFNAADRALYYAKRTGGNRTSVVSKMLPSLTETVAPEIDIERESLNTIYALAATIEARDPYTYGHSRKVGRYAVALAEALGLPSEKVAIVSTAALLHDIGKIGIPDEVLNKVTELEPEEWELIRSHSKLSAAIVGHVPSLIPCLPAILHHQERWDGTGYPSGLKGEAIPLEARILAVADTFDAMTSPRSYRGPMPYKEVLEELKRCAGSQLDPKLVEAFLPIALATAPEELAVGKNPNGSDAD